MTYAWDNDSTQNAHIKQMRDDRQKAYMETHRDNKAYERFKHMPDYGEGVKYEKKNGTITEEFQQRKAVEVLKDAIEIVKGGGIDA